MFLDSRHTVIFYILQLVRFAMCCTSVLDFYSKNLQIISKLLTHGVADITNILKVLQDILFLSKFGEISFQEYVSEGISHPVFYGDLVYKIRRVKGAANFVSSGSKIVKRLQLWKYDLVIIE